MDLPVMLYKAGPDHGHPFEWDGEVFSCIVLDDADEVEAALEDGWVPHKPAKADPLDHDGDGRKGGSKPRGRPRKVAQ